MFHTGTRGFGHGLATHYFEKAQAELGLKRGQMDLGYFTPDSPSLAVVQERGGGGRQLRHRQPPAHRPRRWRGAFAETFGGEAEMVYEISHNLVQEESHPDLFRRPVWVHRKGATRALPAGHPMLAGTRWADTGHPVIIPGSMGDFSYILRPLPGRRALACTR